MYIILYETLYPKILQSYTLNGYQFVYSIETLL